MSRRVASLPFAAALALAGIGFTLPARAQTPPPEPPPASAYEPAPAPQPPPGQVIVVVPSAPAQPYYAPPPGYAPPPAYGPAYPSGPAYAPPPPAAYYPRYYAPAYAPPAEPPAPRQDGFTMKLWAGPAYRRLFDVAFAGADVGMFFGGERRGMVWSGGLGGFFARSDQGLATWQIRPGASWEVHLERVRIGLGLDFSWLGIQRATDGDMLSGVSIGGQLFASVDLVQSGKHALYLGAKMSADWFTTSGDGGPAVLWGPTAMIGWRY